MALVSIILNSFCAKNAAGTLPWAVASDIRARLVMSNTTCGNQNDGIVHLSDYTTIDKADATSYADVALTSEAVVKSDTNNRAECNAADVVFSGLGGDATRDYVGALLYSYVDGTNANDLPVAFVKFTSTIPKQATKVTLPFAAIDGILRLTVQADNP
jgi:hypothetical protein